MKPVDVGGFGPHLEDMVKLIKAAPHVIEYAVQNHTDMALMSFRQEFSKGFIATQQRVHLEIIVRIVAVVGGGLENRVQVDRIDA